MERSKRTERRLRCTHSRSKGFSVKDMELSLYILSTIREPLNQSPLPND